MKYPGYLLNPGDMFSVDPEMVMLATGQRNSQRKRELVSEYPPPDAPENMKSEFKGGNAAEIKERVAEKLAKRAAEKAALASTEAPSEGAAETESSSTATAELPKEIAPEEPVDTTTTVSPNQLKARLKDLETEIGKYIASSNLGKGYVFRTRRKQRLFKLRELRRQIREAIKTSSSSPSTEEGESPEDSPNTIKTLTNRLSHIRLADDPIAAHMSRAHPTSSTFTSPPIPHLELLRTWPNAPLPSKPYLTPFLPRHWMSAFAFIPRYLEVNQNVCSAVYLRHPVARPGLAEVPSPYGKEMGLLAYQWYLRRR
jgi:ribosomal protein S4